MAPGRARERIPGSRPNPPVPGGPGAPRSLPPPVPAAAGAPLSCAGTGRRAARGESARLRSGGGEQNLRSKRVPGRLRESAVQGALGRSHHAARGRAGPGRAGLRAAPARLGFARVWRPALVPPLSAALKPMARRPLPRSGLPRPQGGRRGGREDEVGGTGFRAPQRRLSWKTPPGGALTPGEKTLGNQNPGPAPPGRDDFLGKL